MTGVVLGPKAIKTSIVQRNTMYMYTSSICIIRHTLSHLVIIATIVVFMIITHRPV